MNTSSHKLFGFQQSLLAIALACAFQPAGANPTGASVINGAALTSTPAANVMQIVTTPGTVINWQGFSIGAAETTRFVQQNGVSAVLNRVTGGNPSDILGRLESNGRVFLINPNGIIFGAGAAVDVAGLIASTRDISDANFVAGHYLFNGGSNGAVTLEFGAAISTTHYAATGGQIWLIAKNITQQTGSTLTAPAGQVVLAAGNQVEVGTTQTGQMSFSVTTDGTNTLDSLGSIAADRGAVGMFADFLNHRGTLNAADGKVYLQGGNTLTVSQDAVINADGANGRIELASNNLLVATSGNTHAIGGQVIFNQTQPSQYLANAPTQAWVTPTGQSDNGAVVFRAPDGNYVVRFQRSTNTGEAVGLFEVVLDGLTGAVLAAPVQIREGGAEAAAYNAARANAASIQAALQPALAAAGNTLNAALLQAMLTANTESEQAATTAAASILGLSATIDGFNTSSQTAIHNLLFDAQGNPVTSHLDSAGHTLPGYDGYALANVINDYAINRFSAIWLSTYDSFRAPANLLPGVDPNQANTVATYSQALATSHTAYLNANDAAYAAAGAATTTAYNNYAQLGGAQESQAIALAAYNAAMVANTPVFYGGNGLDGLPAQTRIPTSDGGAVVATLRTVAVNVPAMPADPANDFGGSPAHRQAGGESLGFELQNNTGAIITGGLSGNPVPLSDGTILVDGFAAYNLNGTWLNDVVPSSSTIVIPNHLGGFSQLEMMNGNSLLSYTKDTSAYTRAPLVGSVGSNFPLRDGIANGTLTTNGNTPPPPTTGGGTPTTPNPLVVHGRATGGAIFDGIAGCDFTCAEAARAAVNAVEADIIRQAVNQMAEDALDADITAQALAAARAAVDAELSRQAATAQLNAQVMADINANLDAHIEDMAATAEAADAARKALEEARIASENIVAIGEMRAEESENAVLALKLLSDNERKVHNLLTASHVQNRPLAGSYRQVVGTLMEDDGEFRRLVNGDPFSSKTPEQRVAALDLLVSQATAEQALALTSDDDARSSMAIKYSDLIANMSTPEKLREAERIVEEQAARLRGTP